MAFIMGIGFPLSLLAGFPAFQSLLGGQQTGNAATLRQIEDASVKLRENDCDRPPAKIKGADRDACAEAFRDVGAGYLALTAPDQETGLPPRGADENFEKATVALRSAYALRPDDTDIAQSLASAYVQQQKYPAALRVYQDLVKQEPGNVDFQFGLGSIAQQAQENDVALAAYKRFLKLAPDDSRATQVKESITTIKDAQKSGGSGQNIDLSSLGGAGGGAISLG